MDEEFDEHATDEPTVDPATPRWTAPRGRVLGALIEKALATPQNYPLTLNALAAACNQTTNRDPITSFSESELQQLLDEAKADGLARFVHPRSGRGVTKFKHVVDEVFELETDELAVIGVLLLRGPQTVSEVRARTERLAGLADNAETEAVLRRLTERQPQPLTRQLEREPGSRERRWIQLLCPAQGSDRQERVGASASPHDETVTSAPTPAPSVTSVTSATSEPSVSTASDGTTRLEELEAEVAALREEVDGLRTVVHRLRRELGDLTET